MRALMRLLTLCACLSFATAANAAGECAGIGNAKKRMTCIENKADALATRISTLEKRVGAFENKPTALPKNVKICMPTRPGECLAYVDDGAAPRTVGGEQPDSRWDLQ